MIYREDGTVTVPCSLKYRHNRHRQGFAPLQKLHEIVPADDVGVQVQFERIDLIAGESNGT